MFCMQKLLCLLISLLSFLSEDKILIKIVHSLPKWVVLINIFIGGQSIVLVKRKNTDDRHCKKVYDQNGSIFTATSNHISIW